MAYSEKIKLKDYKRLRIWLSVKKVAEFVIPTAAVFGALGYSKYCPLVGTLFFGGLFAWFWFKKIQILDFFLPDWEGEVVEKIAYLSKKTKAKLAGTMGDMGKGMNNGMNDGLGHIFPRMSCISWKSIRYQA